MVELSSRNYSISKTGSFIKEINQLVALRYVALETVISYIPSSREQ